MLAAAKAGEDLETLAAASEKASYSYSDEAGYFGDNVTSWLFDDARKSGDWAHLDNSGTNQYVVHFKDRYRNEAPTIDVRHILFMIEPTLAEGEEGYEAEVEQLLAEARAEAEEVYAQWKAGEATEDSFAALAMEHSDDGNQYSGGLYTQVTEGYMVQEFNDWCFDKSRKAGDTDIVMTQFGAHVMYFVGQNDTIWELDATATLQTEDSNIWLDEMAGRYTATQHSFGMKFVH
jgi:parvulin-like peptidyl-prolyl isomerase